MRDKIVIIEKGVCKTAKRPPVKKKIKNLVYKTAKKKKVEILLYKYFSIYFNGLAKLNLKRDLHVLSHS
jgi:hypothetical protein